MDDREWEKQELEAMKRLALSAADRARWDSLDPKGLLPSRVARRLGGLKYLARGGDPFADYKVEASSAFRASFDPGPEEAADAAADTQSADEQRRGRSLLRRKRKGTLRLFGR
jgi:hypothetical protein